jgi:hypothetical protein
VQIEWRDSDNTLRVRVNASSWVGWYAGTFSRDPNAITNFHIGDGGYAIGLFDYFGNSEYVAPVDIKMKVNVGDVWKTANAAKLNVGDAWKAVTKAQLNIGDVWKTVF